jgi:hypothetical protein
LTIRRAADLFDVPRSTLQTRRNGTTERAITRANCHKLTELEEKSLENWISMDDRGIAPRHELVRDMANLLLSQRSKGPSIAVGKNWVTKFIKRKPELDTRYTRRRDYRRAL